MSQPKNIVIACDLIDPPNDACKIKPDKVERLAKSVKVNGLLQPPGVVAVGDRYRMVYGNHRFHAWLGLGNSEIEVRVLPPSTSTEQELSISLQENHVREDECFFDTLARVEKRAKQRKCSFKEAAKLEDVNPNYVSRVKRIARIDKPLLKRAMANEVGFSVLYEISGTTDVERQKQFLDAYLEGSMNREAIADAAKKKSKRPVKKVNIERVEEDATIKITARANATYALVYRRLAELQKFLKTCEKNGIPLDLVSKVKKGGQENVAV